MAGLPLGGILKVTAMYLVPIAVIFCLQHRREVKTWVVGVGRRVHLLHEPPPDPWGPPLEDLAVKLRRLYPRVHHPREGMANAKLRGIAAAYDGALADTARALGVETFLADLPTAGTDREVERLRLERALTSAGLVLERQER